MDILDQECSQQVLLNLARHCVDWKMIGFHLELAKDDIIEINKGYEKEEEKQVKMLEKWKEKFSSKATHREFIEALLLCKKALDAVEACKVIKSSK